MRRRLGYSLAFAAGINDFGQIVGFYSDSLGVNHGFVYRDGHFTRLNDPLAGVEGAHALAINNSGTVVGYYNDSAGVERSFIYSNGTFAQTAATP